MPCDRSRPSSEDEALPVVLVHGILGQQRLYWNLLKRRLMAEGFTVHEVTLPALGLADLRSSATAIGNRLDHIRENWGLEQVDVLAHSAGGLASRWFVKHYDHDHAVRRLVTMGSPHDGTRSAGLVPGRGLITQVRPGSSFLKELNKDPTPGPTTYTAIWTHVDAVVLPASSARLPPAPNVENLLYPGIMHWGYLTGPRFARVLAAELRDGFVGGERRVGWDGFRGTGVPAGTEDAAVPTG
jgi:triacylglycerol esterase/lipase EstA (alpha/beta hydrolase family)